MRTENKRMERIQSKAPRGGPGREKTRAHASAPPRKVANASDAESETARLAALDDDPDDPDPPPGVGSGVAVHVAGVSTPLELHALVPETVYPLAHTGWHVAPAASVAVQSPALAPFVGTADASHVGVDGGGVDGATQLSSRVSVSVCRVTAPCPLADATKISTVGRFETSLGAVHVTPPYVVPLDCV